VRRATFCLMRPRFWLSSGSVRHEVQAAVCFFSPSSSSYPRISSRCPGSVFARLGCGGGSSSALINTPGTPAGTYTATVSATSCGVDRHTALTVVVQ